MGAGGHSIQHEKEVVLLIHGTNASDPADCGTHWWQRESEFWGKLSKNLGDNFECQPAGSIFHWTGLNSETHRRGAAAELAQWIVRLEDAKIPYHLIGHSHGGSVIWHALQSAAVIRKELRYLKSWATIGTPFLHYGPRPLSLYWVAPFVLALTAVVLSIPDVRSYVEVINEVAHDPSARLLPLLIWPVLWILPTVFLAAIFVRIGVLLTASSHTAVERRAAEVTYNALWSRYVAVWCEVDEAIGGLASTLGFKGAIVPRIKTLNSSVAWTLLSALTFPLRLLYNGAFAPASDEFIWDRVKRRLQGNDRFGYDMVKVTRGPIPSFPSWPQLPLAVREQLVKVANTQAASTLAAVRNVLGLAASSNSELPTTVTAIGTTVQNRELVHTLYYTNEDICKLLALHVTANRTAPLSYQGSSVPPTIEAWLESGRAETNPAGVPAVRPVGNLTELRRRTAMLPILQSTATVAALGLAWMTSSTIHIALIYPSTEHYQIENILNQDILARVTSGPDITEGVLRSWTTSVTRAGFEDRALSAAAQLERNDRRLVVMATVVHELLHEGRSDRAVQ
jgi:pimeloyl-ACP methyl ester carboxylesterase